ncbi:hypothetical protein D3C79_637040 [compost metagenome]
MPNVAILLRCVGVNGEICCTIVPEALIPIYELGEVVRLVTVTAVFGPKFIILGSVGGIGLV